LVAYSTDKTYIATVRQFSGIVTVFNCVSSTSWQFSNTDMRVEDIKIADNTIFVVGDCKLVGWDLEADGIVHNAPRRVTVDETLAISGCQDNLTLSHDCSQIASTKGENILLYDTITQKTKTIHTQPVSHMLHDLSPWFSPDGCRLWFAGWGGAWYFMELGAGHDQSFVELTETDLEDEQTVFNHSSHGHHIREDSGWVTDSRGRKLLWLPPSWRSRDPLFIRWDGNFLALLDSHHPGPIIIKFHA